MTMNKIKLNQVIENGGVMFTVQKSKESKGKGGVGMVCPRGKVGREIKIMVKQPSLKSQVIQII